MTIKQIGAEIDKHDRKIIDVRHQLDTMRPAFLYDYAIINRLDSILQDAIACKDMLSDMLKDGGN